MPRILTLLPALLFLSCAPGPRPVQPEAGPVAQSAVPKSAQHLVAQEAIEFDDKSAKVIAPDGWILQRVKVQGLENKQGSPFSLVCYYDPRSSGSGKAGSRIDLRLARSEVTLDRQGRGHFAIKPGLFIRSALLENAQGKKVDEWPAVGLTGKLNPLILSYGNSQPVVFQLSYSSGKDQQVELVLIHWTLGGQRQYGGKMNAGALRVEAVLPAGTYSMVVCAVDHRVHLSKLIVDRETRIIKVVLVAGSGPKSAREFPTRNANKLAQLLEQLK